MQSEEERHNVPIRREEWRMKHMLCKLDENEMR